MFDETDLNLMFAAGGDTDFSFTFTTQDDSEFEGFHTFVIMINNSTIVPQSGDNAETVITISDFNGWLISIF